MIQKLPTLSSLIKSLQNIPYFASKNLYKVVTYLLTCSDDKIDNLCSVLLKSKLNIVFCELCFMWKERSLDCIICSDAKRDKTIICVVETWQELLTIDKLNAFFGMYHVLGGSICPLEGVGPEDLKIKELIKRVIDFDIKEIVLATNQTPEGEATASYIAKKLENHSVVISCLAKGIPVGSSIEFMDKLTLYRAISDRRLF